jgi:DNA-binding XRE family transcriptional regulator
MPQFITINDEEMVLLTKKDYEALFEPPEINVMDYLIALDADFEEIGAPSPLLSLKAARKARKLSQKQLATNVNLTQAMISGLESGDIKGSRETWVKLSNALDISIDYLLK